MLLKKNGFLRINPHLFLFLIPMAAGILLGALMYLFIGLLSGYDLKLWICLVGGVAFGVLIALGFYGILFVEFLRQRILEKKLDALRESLRPFEFSFFGATKLMVPCDTILCFREDRLCIVRTKGLRTYLREYDYDSLRPASLWGINFSFTEDGKERFVFLECSSEDLNALQVFLLNRGLLREACFHTTGKLFLREKERTESLYAELFFCRKDEEGRFHSLSEDSLAVHAFDGLLFLSEYEPCFSGRSFADFHAFDLCDEDLRDDAGLYEDFTFSKEKIEQILAKVKELRPVGCDDLIPWLERAVAEYDGIVFCDNTILSAALNP